MDNNRNVRIKANVLKDQKLDIHLQQNVGLFQILSLSLRQSDAYVNKSSNYGIIVGRVLANQSVGIENAKVSVFVPITDDYYLKRIRSVYPFRNINQRNSINGLRYNLLEDEIDNECHTDVGSFPNKRLLLDDDTYIEVFEKYYKYTTTTNKAGDYMIYGVPTGTQQVHVDIDLSDIGILSQRPRDMYYQGYNQELFKNANQFKESSNLDSLAQIVTEDKSVEVYPFWGDSDNDLVAITRCDIDVNYKFESTCIFMGSVVTDEASNSIGNRCVPARYVGKNYKLVTGEGTIEMIRKTQDGYTEEYNVKGGRVIDADGIWCYQIPMNLDYVVTDEEGKLIPSEDPNKGIATRARVRFRFSMDEMEGDGKSRHRAKYLVPNNPIVTNEDVYDEQGMHDRNEFTYDGDDFDIQYEYGSDTQDSDFRDLQWNKVYTVKSYIPRITNSKTKKKFLPCVTENTRAFVGIKSSNNSGDNNPFPFNNFMGSLSFTFRFICMLYTFFISLLGFINTLFSELSKMGFSFKFASWHPFKNTFTCKYVQYENNGHTWTLMPHCYSYAYDNTCRKEIKCDDIYTVTDSDDCKNKMQDFLAEEFDAVDLDFSNDWVNGTLYFPLWHWLKKKKKKFFFGLFSRKAVDRFCNCDKSASNSINYHYAYKFKKLWTLVKEKAAISSIAMPFGLIKQFFNKDNVDIYYYAPAVIANESRLTNSRGRLQKTGDKSDSGQIMYRLFSTDIVLLGSLVDNDLDGVGKLYRSLPQTTAKVPPLIYEIEDNEDNTKVDTTNGLDIPYKTILETGMDEKTARSEDGLFFGISCNSFYSLTHGLINAERICELGVESDVAHYYPIKQGNTVIYGLSKPDQLINKIELFNSDVRAEFATYNQNKLIVSRVNKNTGYKTYDYEYKYPLNFDGTLTGFHGFGNEKYSQSYIDFRMGKRKFFYDHSDSVYKLPIYNNSFYFYFGLKDGKTAIDKFKSLYYVDCVKDSKLGFGINVNVTKNPSSCIIGSSGKGAISIDMSQAAKPYEMYIKDEYNNELFRVSNCNSNTIDFSDGEWDVSKKSDAYESVVLASGIIQPGLYTIYAEDSMSKLSYVTMDLYVSSIMTSVQTSAFKKKRIEMTYPQDNAYRGYFYLDQITVDGNTEDISNIQDVTSSFDESKVIDLESITAGISKYWFLRINGTYYFVGYQFHGSSEDYNTLEPDFLTLENMDGHLAFTVTEPCTINLNIIKLCGPDYQGMYTPLEDFAGVIYSKVNDFESYKLTLDGVDIPEWVGMVSSSNNTTVFQSSDLWKPESYQMNDHTVSYQYWTDVIEDYNLYNTVEEKAVAVVGYKFNSLCKIADMVYMTSTGDKNVSVGYDCQAVSLAATTDSYAMYPNSVTDDAQHKNSISAYTIKNSEQITLSEDCPSNVMALVYKTQSSGSVENPYYSYKPLGDESKDDYESYTDTFTCKYNCNEVFNYSTIEEGEKYQKNMLYNGYGQNFGLYNCFVTSNDNGTVYTSPSSCKYQSGTILEDREKKQSYWFSFDTYDNNFSSESYIFHLNNDKAHVTSIVYGGLYFDAEEQYDYSYNADELGYFKHTHNILGTIQNHTSYQYDLSDGTLRLNTTPSVASLYASYFSDINPDTNRQKVVLFPTQNVKPTEFALSQTAGYLDVSTYKGVNLVLANNTFDVDIETSTDGDGNYSLSGIVNSGSSFSRTISTDDDSTVQVSLLDCSSERMTNMSSVELDFTTDDAHLVTGTNITGATLTVKALDSNTCSVAAFPCTEDISESEDNMFTVLDSCCDKSFSKIQNRWFADNASVNSSDSNINSLLNNDAIVDGKAGNHSIAAMLSLATDNDINETHLTLAKDNMDESLNKLLVIKDFYNEDWASRHHTHHLYYITEVNIPSDVTTYLDNIKEMFTFIFWEDSNVFIKVKDEYKDKLYFRPCNVKEGMTDDSGIVQCNFDPELEDMAVFYSSEKFSWPLSAKEGYGFQLLYKIGDDTYIAIKLNKSK